MTPDIYLHNTLSNKKEKFEPVTSGEVKIYSCGPTVYDFAHIGNFRSFLMSDLLVRVLRYAGYKTIKAQNITDVGHLVADSDDGEDKILKKAKLEKKDPFEITKFFTEAFLEDEKTLRILPPEYRPVATEFITEQIGLAEKLIEEGFAYEVNGSVYFRTRKFKKYGQLSGNKVDDLQAGKRVEISAEKEDPVDFALWKKADENHLMQWDSPWGKGFPGWHIECSAMSAKLLGLPFDVHTGGEDNVFPHHECEIAQNESANNGKKSVNYWLHIKHLLVEGKKMSKSAGNFYIIKDLLDKGWKGEEIRYALLGAHYRSTLDFSYDSLVQARSSIERLEEAKRIFSNLAGDQKGSSLPETDEFKKSLFDDLNVADSLSITFNLIKKGMKAREEKKLTAEESAGIVKFLEEDFNSIFDVFIKDKELSGTEKKEIEELISQRNKFREEKNWGEADWIRDELLEKGIELIDEDGKTTWKII